MVKSDSNFDILIKQIDIVSYSGSKRQSIIPQVSRIDIFESILNPIISCDVILSDQNNIIETFPLIQKKVFLELEYSAAKLEGSIKRRFIINEVGTRVYDSQLKTATYTLKCLSEEILNHTNQVISRDISQTQISDEIRRIIRQDLKSKKPIYCEDTKGVQTLQLLNLKPFKAIDFLRQKAISSIHKSNSFVFYESHKGFFFVTLEKLINQLRSPSDSIFYLSLGDAPDSRGRFRNIIGYQGIVQDNSTDILSSGAYTKHKRLDILTGNIIEIETKPNVGQFFRGLNVDVDAHSSTFINDNTKKPGKTIFSLYDSSLPDTFAEELPLRDFYVSLCTKHITRIYVYGDPTLVPGHSINIQMPIVSSKIDNQDRINYSKYMSGNHLISKIRHMISVQGGSSFSYNMSLELIRPAYGETVL